MLNILKNAVVYVNIIITFLVVFIVAVNNMKIVRNVYKLLENLFIVYI